ncbi:MAG TPA: hypothetical protein VLI72_10640, partial [Methylibium sp.]|nr:hypothetical protein [Methylibium sp.]
VVIVEISLDRLVGRTSTISGTTMATPTGIAVAARQAASGYALRALPRRKTYTTSWDINHGFCNTYPKCEQQRAGTVSNERLSLQSQCSFHVSQALLEISRASGAMQQPPRQTKEQRATQAETDCEASLRATHEPYRFGVNPFARNSASLTSEYKPVSAGACR